VQRICARPDLSSDKRLTNVLTWALTRLDRRSGFDLANWILSGSDENLREGFLHFFSQHEPGLRYDIIKYYISQNLGNYGQIRRLGALLKNSRYDFHEELQYLNIYSE